MRRKKPETTTKMGKSDNKAKKAAARPNIHDVVKDLREEVDELQDKVQELESNLPENGGGGDYENTQSTHLVNRVEGLEKKLDDEPMKDLINRILGESIKKEAFRSAILGLMKDSLTGGETGSGGFTKEQLKARGNFHSLEQLNKSIYKEGVEK